MQKEQSLDKTDTTKHADYKQNRHFQAKFKLQKKKGQIDEHDDQIFHFLATKKLQKKHSLDKRNTTKHAAKFAISTQN